jgi:hypothetical protein
MTKEELEAQITLKEMSEKELLKAEFDTLRPSVWRFIFTMGSSFFFISLMFWIDPDFGGEPTSLYLIFLILLINANTYYESDKINKRIDMLYKMLKD